MKLRFLKFRQEDYAEYALWFEQPEMRQFLGGVDEEWLDHILTDEQGVEYGVFQREDLVAVVGIQLPTRENPNFVITNIAVRPDAQNRGIGSRVLRDLIKLHPLKSNENWLAYISIENRLAQLFFKKNGWKKNQPNQEQTMIRYQYVSPKS